jgi:hypothetical protein
MNRMNFLIRMAGISLAWGMMAVGCDHGGGGDSVVYTSTTDKGETMELTITKAAGNANILANAGGLSSVRRL